MVLFYFSSFLTCGKHNEGKGFSKFLKKGLYFVVLIFVIFKYQIFLRFLFSRFLNIEFFRCFYFRESTQNCKIAKISKRKNSYVYSMSCMRVSFFIFRLIFILISHIISLKQTHFLFAHVLECLIIVLDDNMNEGSESFSNSKSSASCCYLAFA